MEKSELLPYARVRLCFVEECSELRKWPEQCRVITGPLREEEATQAKNVLEQAASGGVTYCVRPVRVRLESLATLLAVGDKVSILLSRSVESFLLILPLPVYRRPDAIEHYLRRRLDDTIHIVDETVFERAEKTRLAFAKEVARQYSMQSEEERIKECNRLSEHASELLRQASLWRGSVRELGEMLEEHHMANFTLDILRNYKEFLEETRQ